MIGRFDWMAEHGFNGMRLGIVDVDWVVKFETYLIYLEFLEEMKGKTFTGKKTPRSEAILYTADKLNIHRSTVWEHVGRFDYRSPPPIEQIKIYRNRTHWMFVNSGKNAQALKI